MQSRVFDLCYVAANYCLLDGVSKIVRPLNRNIFTVRDELVLEIHTLHRGELIIICFTDIVD